MHAAKLLLGEEFSTSMHNDMTISARYKKQCGKSIKTLTSSFNAAKMSPLLYKKGLLTPDECERLVNNLAMTT